MPAARCYESLFIDVDIDIDIDIDIGPTRSSRLLTSDDIDHMIEVFTQVRRVVPAA